MPRRWIALIAFACVVVAAIATPVSARSDRVDRTPSDDAIGYWTPDRVAGATPRDVVLDSPGRVELRPKPDNPGGGNGKGDNGGGEDEDPPATGDVDGAPWPDPGGDPTADLVGKVLFTLGSGDYVCSASTVAPSSGSAWIVLTAGHCTWDDSVGLASNWVFVPNYEEVLKFGCDDGDDPSNKCYVYESLHPADAWRDPGNDYDNDVAFVRMKSSLPPYLVGETLPVVTLDSAIGTDVSAFGYPAAKKYGGSDLIYCTGTAVSGPGSYSSNAALACNMTGGSSGGPWWEYDGNGNRFVVSLNSFGLRGFNGYMFGPVFGSEADDALKAASSP